MNHFVPEELTSLLPRLKNQWKACPISKPKTESEQDYLNVRYWRRIYEKHGSCSGLSTHDYFERALNLYDEYAPLCDDDTAIFGKEKDECRFCIGQRGEQVPYQLCEQNRLGGLLGSNSNVTDIDIDGISTTSGNIASVGGVVGNDISSIYDDIDDIVGASSAASSVVSSPSSIVPSSSPSTTAASVASAASLLGSGSGDGIGIGTGSLAVLRRRRRGRRGGRRRRGGSRKKHGHKGPQPDPNNPNSLLAMSWVCILY